MTESPLVDLGFEVPVFSQGDDLIACLNKAMAFLTVVASSRFLSTNNQLRTSSNPRNHALFKMAGSQCNKFREDKTEDLNTYDSECDDILNVKAVLMANIYNYGSGVILKVPHSETYLNDMENQSVLAMQDFKQPQAVDFIDNEIHSDSNIIPLIKDFRKRFTPQQELSAEQAFWLRMSDPTSKPSDALLVKIEAPKEFPKISLVNESLKKLKFYLAKFDNVVKIRIAPNARTKELENSVAKLCSKNERLCNEINHVQQVFKEQLDSIKKTRVRTKEQSDSLIVKVNLKSTENEDLKAQIQGLKCLTSNYGSKPSGNKKNNRISQAPSRNIKNKVEAQPRNVNKKNHIVEPIRNVDVKQSQLNANFELIFATCKKSMFDGVHDLCILDFVKNVNSHAKSAKKHKNKIFRNLRVMITSANVVPPKKTTSHLVKTQKPGLKVYRKKPKNVKNVGSSRKAKIVESKNANHSEPNHTWGSNAIDIPSSSSLVMTDAKVDIGIFVGYAPAKKAFRIYNKITQKIIETIHVTFDELIAMDSEQFNSGPRLHYMTLATSSSGLVPNTVSQKPSIPPPRDDWDLLFQPMFDEYFTPS
nr:hypothetical protein [Tanacetum cinerariifolium]